MIPETFLIGDRFHNFPESHLHNLNKDNLENTLHPVVVQLADNNSACSMTVEAAFSCLSGG